MLAGSHLLAEPAGILGRGKAPGRDPHPVRRSSVWLPSGALLTVVRWLCGLNRRWQDRPALGAFAAAVMTHRRDPYAIPVRRRLRTIMFSAVAVVIVLAVIVEPLGGMFETVGLAVVLVTMLLLILRERGKPS
jgi:peptidoglycan/LPS O-acetylase OafA/YrhL